MLARTLGRCPRRVLLLGADDGFAAPFPSCFEFDETVNPYVLEGLREPRGALGGS